MITEWSKDVLVTYHIFMITEWSKGVLVSYHILMITVYSKSAVSYCILMITLQCSRGVFVSYTPKICSSISTMGVSGSKVWAVITLCF